MFFYNCKKNHQLNIFVLIFIGDPRVFTARLEFAIDHGTKVFLINLQYIKD